VAEAQLFNQKDLQMLKEKIHWVMYFLSIFFFDCDIMSQDV